MPSRHDQLFGAEMLPKAVSQDLLKIGGANPALPICSLEQGLIRLGIISANDKLIFYRDNSSWSRGGAETYVSDFEISYRNNSDDVVAKHIIAKAIVKISPSIDSIASEWLQRQQRLSAYGVSTPHHFSYWEGVVFQEYIKYSFSEYFTSLAATHQAQFAISLLKMADLIDQAGFYTTDLVSGLRTDGERIYLVDVGEDLGHFRTERQGPYAIILTRKWLMGFPHLNVKE